MKFAIEQERIASTYDAKPIITNFNITVKNISHTTLRIPKREIEKIKWLFSGDLRENER